VNLFGFTPGSVNADCWMYCEPAYRSGTSAYINEFCCPGMALPPDCLWFDGESWIQEDRCADMRIDFIDDSDAVVYGDPASYYNYALESMTYRFDVFYGDCGGDTCNWTPDPGNTFTDVGNRCVDCPW
jgi:hypothetical protein